MIEPVVALSGPLRDTTFYTRTRGLRALAGKDAYPLPTMTLPSHSMETLTERPQRFEELCAKHDVVTRNTRIDRYRRYLEQSQPKG
jgi:hypothetical protein